MSFIKSAVDIFRDYVTSGVPASGPNQPNKADLRAWGSFLELVSNLGAGLAYATLAAINADLAHGASTFAIVYGDATPANNGMYVKVGVSGSGSWSRVADLPTSVVRLTVTGGTANSIVATAPESPTLPAAKLFLLTPSANNTGATQINVNGQGLVNIQSALGSSLAANALLTGCPVLMTWQVDHYALLVSTPVDATGVLTDAIAARDTAAASAASAASSASVLGNQVAQYDTRAAAIAATIPAGCNFVRTLAYDSHFVDNSGAQFKRVPAGTPFTDTWPTAGTIAGGTGYTNGTYYGCFFSGSATGLGLVATITVSGGAVTAVDFSTQPGNAYKVGDVLTCNNAFLGGTGSGFTYTVTAISSPLASFVNTHDGSLWQYMQSKGVIHVNEFGANPDYINADAGTTNNFAPIQAALFYAVCNLTGTSADASGYSGAIVKCGIGSYRLLHPSNSTMLIVPNGVWFEGVSGTTLKFDDNWFASTHCVAIGNPNARFANFRCGIRHMTLFVRRGIITTAFNTFVVYSNNMQDGAGLEHVEIYSGQRGGLKYEIGYGGASTVKFHDLYFAIEGPNPAARFDLGTTLVSATVWSVNAPSGGRNDTVDAIVLGSGAGVAGGMYDFQNIHMEGFPNGFNISLTGAGGYVPMASFKGITGGNRLAWVFTLQSTNLPGNASFERCQTNNGLATGLVQNGQPGGTSRLSNIGPADGIVKFNP